MAIEYNIPQLIALAAESVGYNPGLSVAVNALLRATTKVEYQTALKQATDAAIGYESIQTYQAEDYDRAVNTFGLPIYQPITLKATEEGEDDLFLESAVVEYSLPKNIVKTVVDGRDTSVKEFINNGDYMISVSGLICRPGIVYPLEEVQQFKTFMRKNQALDVEHEVMNALGIYQIVIEESKLAKTSFVNTQPYSFSAVSDTPIELNILDLP